MSLDRVKSLTSGKVKNLKREEGEALVRKLGVRGDWLATGEGPMRQLPAEAAKADRLLLVKASSEKANLDGLTDSEKSRLAEILYFAELRDAAAIRAALMTPIAPDAEAANDYVYVPRYDVAASAGNGAVVHDESVVDHLAFRRDWVTRTLGLDAQHLALIDVAGDSMAPTIGDGDLILIDTRPRPVKSEGVYVINLHSTLLVKRLRLRISGEMDVVSDNPLYGTETVNGDQLSQLQIVGRVVWQGRRL